ncbi:hypothetical protein HY623_04485 [Candidatus Uhrbacteria bacterium]|nr:hypothetical protein [Candidatus Uhrbacteria bacterium]
MPDLNFLETGKKKETPVKKRKLFSFGKEKKRAVGVNLITSEAKSEVERAIIRKNGIQLFLSFLLALILSLLVYGVVLLYGTQESGRVAILRQDLNRIEADIALLEKDNKKLLGFQNKLTSIKALLDGQTTFLPFFQKLEENTLPEVSYDTLSFSRNGDVLLSAGAGNYTTLGRQLLAFEQSEKFLKSVQFSGISSSLDQLGSIIGVRFSVVLTLNPEILKLDFSQQ